MDFIAKLKETLTSVLPIMVIVLILNFTITPLGTDRLLRFILGGVMLIIGLSLFLAGTEIGMVICRHDGRAGRVCPCSPGP